MKLSEDEWIGKYGSGTLKYASNLGCAYHDMYKHERLAFEYGANWNFVSKTRFMSGGVLAEADCHPFTEGCWNIRRLIASKDGHPYSCSMAIRVDRGNNEIEEGLGLVLLLNPEYISKGNIVYCIVSPWKRDQFGNAVYTGEVRSL